MSNLNLTNEMIKIMLAFRNSEHNSFLRESKQSHLPLLVTDWEEFARDAIKIIQAFSISMNIHNQKQRAQCLEREGDQSIAYPIPQTDSTFDAAPKSTRDTEMKVATVVSDSEDHSVIAKEKQRKTIRSHGLPKREHTYIEMKGDEIKSPSLDTGPRTNKKQRTNQEQDAANLLLSFSQSYYGDPRFNSKE